MAELGDTLWAWQSQQPDGSWSVVSVVLARAEEIAGMTPERSQDFPRAVVLVHRIREAMLDQMPYALAHLHKYGQPIRLARFELAELEDVPVPRAT
ncbi:hypothetical protein [Candidatus Solirubrobacter pratensis]|uniref:hypothetical protein n=1 Tax=Candidatus Solirubrobacter pratensis TaxID=1298857 RepID=UPI00041223A0|nr:hypothetical protein [Candidatus Solirubrobacter pratensis]